jgi:hypothetical protein
MRNVRLQSRRAGGGTPRENAVEFHEPARRASMGAPPADVST